MKDRLEDDTKGTSFYVQPIPGEITLSKGSIDSEGYLPFSSTTIVRFPIAHGGLYFSQISLRIKSTGVTKDIIVRAISKHDLVNNKYKTSHDAFTEEYKGSPWFVLGFMDVNGTLLHPGVSAIAGTLSQKCLPAETPAEWIGKSSISHDVDLVASNTILMKFNPKSKLKWCGNA